MDLAADEFFEFEALVPAQFSVVLPEMPKNAHMHLRKGAHVERMPGPSRFRLEAAVLRGFHIDTYCTAETVGHEGLERLSAREVFNLFVGSPQTAHRTQHLEACVCRAEPFVDEGPVDEHPSGGNTVTYDADTPVQIGNCFFTQLDIRSETWCFLDRADDRPMERWCSGLSRSAIDNKFIVDGNDFPQREDRFYPLVVYRFLVAFPDCDAVVNDCKE